MEQTKNKTALKRARGKANSVRRVGRDEGGKSVGGESGSGSEQVKEK